MYVFLMPKGELVELDQKFLQKRSPYSMRSGHHRENYLRQLMGSIAKIRSVFSADLLCLLTSALGNAGHNAADGGGGGGGSDVDSKEDGMRTEHFIIRMQTCVLAEALTPRSG
ncbi:unnamed protein product [Dibothriocephalus latus]|uniref:Uncharacterized protein n=1 Tax=Dibothriocephalus latus TaxID=60516 RepID=A0A3P7PDZ1_DIBLA|nr:unnamed protein product [Dibothriocephalus latus]